MLADASLIDSFEQYVFSKDNKKAFNKLIELLIFIDSTGFHSNQISLFDNLEHCEINSTRIISCIIQLFSDKNFKINRTKYLQLLNSKKNIDSLFRISGYHANQNVLNFFLRQYEESNNRNLKDSYLYKLLIFMRLSDHSSDSLNFLIGIDKSIVLPYILSLLSSSVILQENEGFIREQLLNFGEHLSEEIIDFNNSGLLAVAWMHSSYAVREDKHLFKGYLNRIMNNTLLNNGFILPKIKLIDREVARPKILVLTEIFFSHHAMSRCYSNYIIQLKREFEVVLFCAKDSIDDDAANIFDKKIIFDQSRTNIHQIAELIEQQKADIIFYPSVGMSTWVIALLSVRFAPLQIAATGHPATTMSETIDYLIAPDYLLEHQDCYSENLVTIPNALDNTHSSLCRDKYPKVRIKMDSEKLKIAVNGKSSKINSQLLSVCENINQLLKNSPSKSIEWIFFTNETGFLHYHCEYEIKKRLSNARVIKSQDYSDYLIALNKCDIALSPFPFGGSNSNIDLLRLGIPLVYLTGKEAHSRTDEFYYQNFDLTVGMASKNKDELITNLLKLIHDNKYRIKLSNEIAEKNTDSLLISKEISNKSDVLNTFRWLWRNFDTLQKNKVKKVTYVTIQTDKAID